MKQYKKIIALFLSCSMIAGLCACSKNTEDSTKVAGQEEQQENSSIPKETEDAAKADDETKTYIEETLNLANNEEQEWTYSENNDAWVLSIVSAVAYPELPNQQGVSVCVPGAYVTGIDTNGDGSADITSDHVTDAVKGSLVNFQMIRIQKSFWKQ